MCYTSAIEHLQIVYEEFAKMNMLVCRPKTFKVKVENSCSPSISFFSSHVAIWTGYCNRHDSLRRRLPPPRKCL
jgi:hypothetical protein